MVEDWRTGGPSMSDYDDDFMAEDEDYDLEYSEDSNRCRLKLACDCHTV